jgi:hypothetical protein
MRFHARIVAFLCMFMWGSTMAAAPVVAWGDSFTAGAGGTPWTTQFQALSGIETFTFGFGGETSTQIRDRMLADTVHVGDFAVIWVGRNNYDQTNVVIADIAAMVGHLTTSNFLIIGVTNGSYGGYEIRGGEGWTFITQLNSQLSDIYGDRFIDIRAELIARYDPSSPQDVIDFNNDTVPTSLRYDAAHLNTRGYGVVAETVYAHYALAPVPETGRLATLALGLVVVATVVRRRLPSLPRS